MPEKNNSRLGKRFLETLFGVLLATRLCLSHAWRQPHGPPPFPTGNSNRKQRDQKPPPPAEIAYITPWERWEKPGVARIRPPMPSRIQPLASRGQREENGSLKHSRWV